MPLTINTNVSSLIAQRNMNNATNALNASIERMSTGYTINHAKDNAAGYSIAKTWVTQINSLDVAASNAATGSDLLTTAEENYGLLVDHLQRVRDLTEQAANGTYGSTSKKAIQGEITARFQEISRIASNSEFNGIKLMAFTEGGDNSAVGITEIGVDIQVGLYADANSRIHLDIDLFKNASMSGLFKGMASETSESGVTFQNLLKAANGGTDIINTLNTEDCLKSFAAACAGLKKSDDGSYVLQDDGTMTPREMLAFLDIAIVDISDRVTKIGAAQNRLTSALSSIDVQSQNLTSSLSTLRDTDIAAESSNYLQSQILQQASATLLSTANQLPSIALNLL
ncbi:MAG: hypothetical protein MJ237_08080 [bacterium]|nr:hypothetical protein [bacterium]